MLFRSVLKIDTNGSRLEAVANFGSVNFPLLLNFLRKMNVIEPHILPLLSNRCYAFGFLFTNKLKQKL